MVIQGFDKKVGLGKRIAEEPPAQPCLSFALSLCSPSISFSLSLFSHSLSLLFPGFLSAEPARTDRGCFLHVLRTWEGIRGAGLRSSWEFTASQSFPNINGLIAVGPRPRSSANWHVVGTACARYIAVDAQACPQPPEHGSRGGTRRALLICIRSKANTDNKCPNCEPGSAEKRLSFQPRG